MSVITCPICGGTMIKSDGGKNNYCSKCRTRILVPSNTKWCPKCQRHRMKLSNDFTQWTCDNCDNSVTADYSVVHGVKIIMTDEQSNQVGACLGLSTTLNPYNDEQRLGEYYYTQGAYGIESQKFTNAEFDKEMIAQTNSYNNEDYAKQRYLHDLLYRKLDKYAWDNNAEDGPWDGQTTLHYYIFYNIKDCAFEVTPGTNCKRQDVYFSDGEIAEHAIKDVIEPFMEEHPEFIW